MICTTNDGIVVDCDRERACSPDIKEYSFDWESHNTLNNWMTQLDLVCIPRYQIGLVGSISFIAFAVGSFLFTKQADKVGRHPVMIVASLVTPVCLTALYFGSKSLGLNFVYALMILMALAYNPRSSTAYLYATEILPPSKRLLFGTILFFIDGMVSVSAAVYFYYVGDQNLFFLIIGAIFVVALAVMLIALPETPSFLLASGQGEIFRDSLEKLTGFKQSHSESLSNSKIEAAARPETSFKQLWSNRQMRNNLVGVCVLSSTTAFCNYMIGYYTKYFPGSFYVNYGILGVADMFCMVYQSQIDRFFKNKVQSVVSFSLISIAAWSLLFLCLAGNIPRIVPLGIFILRLNLSGLENYRYHVVVALF